MAWIKCILVIIIRNLLKICWIKPIISNRIVFDCYGGKQYTCSSKYITEYLLQKKGIYEIIWVVKNPANFRCLLNREITLIEFQSLKYYIYLLTSKIYVTNGLGSSYIPFRKNQIVISTWHGGGAYKKGGLDIVNNFPSRIIMRLVSNSLNIMISSCNAFNQAFHKAFLVSCNKFMNIGLPRNDIFFGDYTHIIEKVKNTYKIDKNTKIVLYAPTFRSDMKSLETNIHAGNYDINIEMLTKVLNKKFSGNWIILFRAHYYLSDNNLSNKIISVTSYPDMQELLCAADILITDYSSCMWDFSLTFKPCFIYATDLAEYEQERDFYTPIDRWPFPLATNNDELFNNIMNFNQEEYIKKVKQHHQELGSYETGHACEKVCKLIDDICNGKVDK